MNSRASHPGKGMRPEVEADIARVQHVWGEAMRAFGGAGPFLFGEFGAADAMYAPVVMRFRTYGVALEPGGARYCRAMQESAGIRAWVAQALEEKEFVAEDEPYATCDAAPVAP
jgi:glutathione S-transferase